MSSLFSSIATCVAAICLNPTSDVVSDDVDLVEINHFYDEQGRLVLDQIIFYDWSPVQARYNVRDYRLLKNPSQIPQRDWSRGEFVATWYDGDTLRKVRADSVRESWTQHDPEFKEQQYLPKERRNVLRRSPSAIRNVAR